MRYTLTPKELEQLITYMEDYEDELCEKYTIDSVYDCSVIIRADYNRLVTSDSITSYESSIGEVFDTIRKIIDDSNILHKKKISEKLDIEMMSIDYMYNEQGIELDCYYLVLGVDEEQYGNYSFHVAELTDLEDDIPLMWLREDGKEIKSVIKVSKYPLPFVLCDTGEIIDSEYDE